MGLDFDGVDDKSEHGDINALDGAAALSTSFWAFIDAATANGGFWSKGETFGVGVSGSDALNFQGHGALAAAQRWRTTDNSLVTGVWVHVGTLYDGAGATDADRFKLFIDGVQKTLTFNAAVPATLASSTTQVTTAQNVTNNVFHNGRVAHLKIWTATLTLQELLNEIHSYRPARTADLQLWCPYDDGVRAHDYSGKGNNGTVTGAVQIAGPPISFGAPD